MVLLWLLRVTTMLAFKPLRSPISFGYEAMAYQLRNHTYYIWVWSVISH